jgi:hypothetical protein
MPFSQGKPAPPLGKLVLIFMISTLKHDLATGRCRNDFHQCFTMPIARTIVGALPSRLGTHDSLTPLAKP